MSHPTLKALHDNSLDMWMLIRDIMAQFLATGSTELTTKEIQRMSNILKKTSEESNEHG